MKKALALMMSSLIAVSVVANAARAGDGAAVAAGIGGFAAGAILGSALAPRPYYYGPPPAPVYSPAPVYVEPEPAMCLERREVWSDRHQAYMIRNVRVPC